MRSVNHWLYALLDLLEGGLLRRANRLDEGKLYILKLLNRAKSLSLFPFR